MTARFSTEKRAVQTEIIVIARKTDLKGCLELESNKFAKL